MAPPYVPFMFTDMNKQNNAPQAGTAESTAAAAPAPEEHEATAPPGYSQSMAQAGCEVENVIQTIDDSLKALYAGEVSFWQKDHQYKKWATWAGTIIIEDIVRMLANLGKALVVHHKKNVICHEDYSLAAETLLEAIVNTITTMEPMVAKYAKDATSFHTVAKALQVKCIGTIEQRTAHIWPTAGHYGYNYGHDWAVKDTVSGVANLIRRLHPGEVSEVARILKMLFSVYVHALTATTSTAEQLSPVYIKHAKSVRNVICFGKKRQEKSKNSWLHWVLHGADKSAAALEKPSTTAPPGGNEKHGPK